MESVFNILLTWSPMIIKGFLVNIGISIASVIFATVIGILVGTSQLFGSRYGRKGSWVFTQFFRNAPWLVVLFYSMFLIPFEFKIAGYTLAIPDWFKAIIGISIAAGANMSEIVRGAIQSIPTGQWESSISLGFSRRQILWQIILPQCIKRMLPPWMNLYALIVVSTPLCAIVGVHEVMTVGTDILASYSRHDLLIPVYAYLLVLFFIYCYPIAILTRKYEKKFAVNI